MVRLFCLLVCCQAVACNLGQGVGRAEGTLFVANCSDSGDFAAPGAPAAFNLRPNFFTADYVTDPIRGGVRHDRLSVRLQSAPNRSENADGIFLQFTDVADAGARVGSAQKINEDSAIRATLRLGQTCPRSRTQMELDGTLSLTAFGSFRAGVVPPKNLYLSAGDPIAGTFEFDIVDRRSLNLGHTGTTESSPSVAGRISGDFSFFLSPDRGL